MSAQLGNETIPFISDQLDEFFNQFGVAFVDIIAIVSIIFGLFIAYLGSRGQGPKLLAFVSGFLVGCYVGALGLEYFDENNENVSTEVWVGVFFLSGILVGIICVCIVKISKIAIGIATGLVVAGVFFQLGVAERIGNEIAIIVIVVILCILSIYAAIKLVDLVYAVLAAFLGGALVILGVGSFTDSPITLNLLTADPESASEECRIAEEDCYIPLGVGTVVIITSLVFNVYGYRKNRKKNKENKKNKDNNNEFVAQMQTDRENFETKLQKLEQSNQAVLASVQGAQASALETSATNSLKLDIQKQEASMKALEAKLEAQQSKDDTNAEVIKKLQLEKEELQEKIEEERLEMEKQAKLAALEMEMTPEKESEKKELYLGIQQEVTEMKLKFDSLTKEYKDAALLEKKLVVKVPKQLQKKKRFNFFVTDQEKEREVEELAELKERGVEFSKLKKVVSKAKASQKSSLKAVKKAFKEVDSLSTNLRKLSMDDIIDDIDQKMKIRKEKEFTFDDLVLKMTVLRTLMSQYQETHVLFLQLIEDIQQKLDEFKQAETALEEATRLHKNSDIAILPVSADNDKITPEEAEQIKKDLEELEALEGGEDSNPTDSTLLVASAALKRTAAVESLDIDSEVGNIETADEISGNEITAGNIVNGEEAEAEATILPPKIWRGNYFDEPERPSTSELNSYLVRWLHHKYPTTMGRLNIFGRKVKSQTQNLGSTVVQKSREYRESRRTKKFLSPQPLKRVSEEDLEVLETPLSMSLSNSPTSNMEEVVQGNSI